MKYYGSSNKGRVRGNNEDFFHVPADENDIKLFVVADGMGGQNAGEVASALAVAGVVMHVNENFASQADTALLLRQAFSVANTAVYSTAHADALYESMGTTLVCALIRDGFLYVANVGDSRCYVISDKLEQISVDHSYVQEMVDKGVISASEARNHPNKNLITRAVGVSKFVQTDIFVREWKSGDRLLLASDGLTGMIKEDDIMSMISDDCTASVKRLVEAANDAGGKDNITAILVFE